MERLRATVHIPLVDLKEESDKLLAIYSEKQSFGENEWDDISLKKEWHFVAAPLKSNGWYDDGIAAINSVRKLGLKKPSLAVYQYFKKFSWLEKQRLHAATRVLNCEGDSAQLGFAIALLLNGSNSSIRCAIATGKLSNEPKINEKGEHDVAIECVNSIKEKLQLLKAKHQDIKLPEEELYCFTPRYYQENETEYEVKDLAEVAALKEHGIKVIPIEWLSEAAKVLKADKSPYLLQDKLWALGLAFMMLLMIAVGSFLLRLHYPIPLQIIAEKNKAEPFLVCSNKDGVTYYDLEYDGGIPLLPVFARENPEYNIEIGWKLRPAKTLLSSFYYVALIHLGTETGYKLINYYPDTGKRITAIVDEEFKMSWDMIEPGKPQDNILIIAMQRTPIDADELNQAFENRFSNSKPLNILAASDFLRDRFPGSYAFPYKSVISDSPCIKPSL